MVSHDVAVRETVKETRSRGRIANRALWVLQIIVGVDFIIGGTLKLVGATSMVGLFDRIGGGQGLRYVVGVAELAGGIGLLIPALCGLASIGLAALMACALYTNVRVIDDPPWVPLIWLVIVSFIAWRRWPRTKALFTRLRR